MMRKQENMVDMCEFCGVKIEGKKYHIVAFYNPTIHDGWRAHNVCPLCFERARKHEFDKDDWSFREEVNKEELAKINVAIKKLLKDMSERSEIERLKALARKALGD